MKEKFDPKKFITEIFEKAVYKSDKNKYPNVAFFGFNTDGKYLFEYNEKRNLFWVVYSTIWLVLETEMDWNYKQTQEFLNGTVEEHFKTKGVTTTIGGLRMADRVEEHFKTKGVTTDPLPVQPGDTPLWRPLTDREWHDIAIIILAGGMANCIDRVNDKLKEILSKP